MYVCLVIYLSCNKANNNDPAASGSQANAYGQINACLFKSGFADTIDINSEHFLEIDYLDILVVSKNEQ